MTDEKIEEIYKLSIESTVELKKAHSELEHPNASLKKANLLVRKIMEIICESKNSEGNSYSHGQYIDMSQKEK